jgi:hypothetical protein
MSDPSPTPSILLAVVAQTPVPDTFGVIDCEVRRIDPATSRPEPGIRMGVRTADSAMLEMFAVGNVVRIELVDGVGEPDTEG